MAGDVKLPGGDAVTFNAQAFARRIRVRIAERGISQADAALEIGCSKATLSRVCRASVPDVENYFRIEAWLTKYDPKP